MTLIVFILDDTSPSMGQEFQYGRGFIETQKSGDPKSSLKFTRFHAALNAIQKIGTTFSQSEIKKDVTTMLFKTSGDVYTSHRVGSEVFFDRVSECRMSEKKENLWKTVDKVYQFLHNYNLTWSDTTGYGFYPPLFEQQFIFLFTCEGFSGKCEFNPFELYKTPYRWNQQLLVFLFEEERFGKVAPSLELVSKKRLLNLICNDCRGMLYEISTIYEMLAAVATAFGHSNYIFNHETKYKQYYKHNEHILPMIAHRHPLRHYHLFIQFVCASNNVSLIGEIMHQPMATNHRWNFSRTIVKGKGAIETFFEKNSPSVGYWPIPCTMPSSTDKDMPPFVSDYPLIYWAESSESDAKKWEFPELCFWKYFLDPTCDLVQLFQTLRHESPQTRQFLCYGSEKDFSNDRPFGYIKKKSGSEHQYVLYVYPYNFVKHIELCQLFSKPNSSEINLYRKVEEYMSSVPYYYYGPLKSNLKRYAPGNLYHKICKLINAKEIKLFEWTAYEKQVKRIKEANKTLDTVVVSATESTKFFEEKKIIIHEPKFVSNAFDVHRNNLLKEWNNLLVNFYGLDIFATNISEILKHSSDNNNKEPKLVLPRSEVQAVEDKTKAVKIKKMADYHKKERQMMKDRLRPLDEAEQRRLDENKFQNPFRILGRNKTSEAEEFGLNSETVPSSNENQRLGARRGDRHRVIPKGMEQNSIKKVSDKAFSLSLPFIEELAELDFDQKVVTDESRRQEVLENIKTSSLSEFILKADVEIWQRQERRKERKSRKENAKVEKDKKRKMEFDTNIPTEFEETFSDVASVSTSGFVDDIQISILEIDKIKEDTDMEIDMLPSPVPLDTFEEPSLEVSFSLDSEDSIKEDKAPELPKPVDVDHTSAEISDEELPLMAVYERRLEQENIDENENLKQPDNVPLTGMKLKRAVRDNMKILLPYIRKPSNFTTSKKLTDKLTELVSTMNTETQKLLFSEIMKEAVNLRKAWLVQHVQSKLNTV